MTKMTSLTAAHLQAGDILLHQPRNPRWFEKGIALCTGSPYTHASIYIGDNTIAEARLPLVRLCNVRKPIRREQALCVLRQHSELNANQVGLLKSFVESALSREARFDFAFPYTYYSRRLMSKLTPGPRRPVPQGPLGPANCNKYFCTSFIVDAFRAMGLIDRSERNAYRLGRHAAVDFLRDEKFGYVLGHIPGSGSESEAGLVPAWAGTG